MAIPKNHYIHLRDGRFAETAASDLEASFESYQVDPPGNGIAIYFHGGLVPQSDAIASAETLLPLYEDADTWPFFYVWESGLIETVKNNLVDISREPFFRRVVAKLTTYLIRKISGLEAVSFMESAGQGPDQQVERWLTDGGPAPFDGDVGEFKLAETEIEEAELERIFAADQDFEGLCSNLRDALVNAETADESPGQRVRLNAPVAGELFGQAETGAAESLSGALWAARVARVAARIGVRIVKRFWGGRDHGLLTTTIEESLRELYLDSIIATGWWNQMKKDTEDAFGGDPNVHGGSAMIAQLRKLIESNPTEPPRVTLVGHSAGAIFVSNFLLAADRVLPPDFKFDVVLLASAVDCHLFSRALATQRIRNVRQLAMSDKLESEDALLAGFHPALSPVYPRSLLYFVSGLLEPEVDQPLVGMERYFSADAYPDADHANLKVVRDFLQPFPDRLVWSPADQGPGRATQATHHGAFNDRDSDTLASLKHILNDGFAALPQSIPESRAVLEQTLHDFSEEEMAAVYEQLTRANSKGPLDRTGPPPEGGWGKKEVSELLDLADELPGGLAQLMVQAHRTRPSAQLLQQHQASRKTDTAVVEALQAQRDAGALESFVPSPESHGSTGQQVQILARLRDPSESLDDIQGMQTLSRVGSIVAAKVSRTGLAELERDPRVLSIEYADKGVVEECAASMPFIGVIDPATNERLQERGDRALIGIIDSGIDVLHAAFRKPDVTDSDGQVTRGATRILAVWDQRDSTGPPPPGLEAVGGTLHTASEINGYIASQRVKKNLGRDDNPLSAASGHGTHVASIAAGTPLPTPHFPGGVAPEAELVVVVTDTPSRSQHESGAPNSIGYSISHNAGLQFIGQIADGKVDDDQLFQQIYGVDRSEFRMRPVVVNFSQGMNAGAHDGTSLVELMFDDFCFGGRAPGRIVVKSAGNDRQKNGHAFITLSSNSIEDLKWKSSAALFNGQRVRDVIELWFDSIAELSFQLISPGGERSPRVNPANPRVSASFPNNKNAYKLDYERFFVDNGSSRLRIELTRGTAPAIESGPKGPPAVRGPWKLEIVAGALASTVEVDAWIDRTDALPIEFQSHVDEERTLSVPGTARSVISVGAIRADTPVRTGDFSAYGTTRDGRQKPEVCAPGVAVAAARGGTEFDLRPDSGTSMAAPHVAGSIALVLSACDKNSSLQVPNANQIASALRSASWDRGRGFGPLNTKTLLERFS